MSRQVNQEQEQKRIGAAMLTAMWVGIFIILGIVFSNTLNHQNNPNQNINTTLSTDNIKQLVLQRNKQGHYVATGKINSIPVVFMLDTGATDVAIPDAIARKLKLTRGPSTVYQTANGQSRVYLTQLKQISLGDITLENIRATINPGYKSNQILLGMSFLKHLEFSQRGNTLTLRQYPEGF